MDFLRVELVAVNEMVSGSSGLLPLRNGAAGIDNIETMNITNGTFPGDVEYTEHEDGTWSFKLTFEDDPVPIESVGNFPTKELAQEQVNYELQAASLRIAEG